RPLPGYEAAECILRRDVAAALKRVQADLAASGLSLKVYDCYRPARAVRAMATWVNDGRSEAATKRYFPKLAKSSLLRAGYIASPSRRRHPRGTPIVHALLGPGPGAPAAFARRVASGASPAPLAQRSPDNAVDMGTSFDCFDPTSHTAAAAIGAEQRRWRNVLLAAM